MSLMDLGKRLLDAAKRGDTDEVRLLMSNGAPFTTDWLGTSPLHFASQNGHVQTAEVLLRAGISRDARTKVDRTPLHVASQYGHENIVQLLIQNNADIEAKDMLKMTPLHWAVENGHFPVIQCLLKQGADLNCENKFDRTALDIALSNSRGDIAQVIQSSQMSRIPITETEIITEETHLVIESSDAVAEIPTTEHDGLSYNIAIPTKESGDQSSTSVLATLAALAEATGPLNNPSVTTATSTADALNLLAEAHGITMISQADNETMVTAVDGGETLTLTEAGKLALKLSVKSDTKDHETTSIENHSDSIDPATVHHGSILTEDGEQKVIAIVQSVADESQSTQDGNIVVTMAVGDSNNIENSTDDIPPAKKAKVVITTEDANQGDALSNWLQGKQSFETLDQDQLKKQLEKVSKSNDDADK